MYENAIQSNDIHWDGIHEMISIGMIYIGMISNLMISLPGAPKEVMMDFHSFSGSSLHLASLHCLLASERS